MTPLTHEVRGCEVQREKVKKGIIDVKVREKKSELVSETLLVHDEL